METMLARYRQWRNKRKWLAIIHQMLDSDDANIVEGVRQGNLPPLKEGLLCKAPQWESLWNL